MAGLFDISRTDVDAEIGEDRRGDVVLPSVDRQPLHRVRIDGVEPGVLQLVGLDLVREADPPTFVTPEVHDHAALGLGDTGECMFQLVAAVALPRAQHVAGEALAVQPGEHAGSGRIALDDGDVFVPVERSVRHDPEVAVGRGEPSVADSFDQHQTASTRP